MFLIDEARTGALRSKDCISRGWLYTRERRQSLSLPLVIGTRIILSEPNCGLALDFFLFYCRRSGAESAGRNRSPSVKNPPVAAGIGGIS